MNLRETAANLEIGERGIWFSGGHSEISYPSSDNDVCYQIEDDSFWFQHRNRCIAACVRAHPPGGTIFDVGGGNGFVSRALQDSGWSTVVVEPGIAGARNARQRGLPNVICSTLQDAGFRKHTLPAAGLFDVLEHVEDPEHFLASIHDALVPQGRLYLTVPAYRWLWSADDVFAGHFRRYTISALISVLAKAGFEAEFASHIFAMLPVPIYLSRTLPSRLGFRHEEAPGSAKEHRSSPRIRGLVDRLFAWELDRIQGQKPIPFGSSCLLAAKSR